MCVIWNTGVGRTLKYSEHYFQCELEAVGSSLKCSMYCTYVKNGALEVTYSTAAISGAGGAENSIPPPPNMVALQHVLPDHRL